jgi:hypothetical protein
MRALGWLFLSLVVVAPAAAAQEDPDGPICIDGAGWRGSGADVRQIEAVPVPESFRQRFESLAPCVRWATSPVHLVDWHLRFGSERSTAAALAYLENDSQRPVPPERYAHELRRAWRAALPVLRQAARIRQREGLSPSAQYRFMEGRPSFRRLDSLIEDRTEYQFMTEYYLRAAEQFGSLALLERAEVYMRALLASADFLRPLEGRAPADHLYFNLDPHRSDTFRLRTAVLRAQLTRSADDIAAARRVVNEVERPPYALLLGAAYSGGDDFCDISEGRSHAETIDAACRADDEIAERVMSWALARSLIDLIADSAERLGDDVLIALLERERRTDDGRCCRRPSAEDELVRLRLQRAEHELRRFAVTTDFSNARQHWRDALGELRRAADLVPPPDAPARFRPIGEAWLRVWARGEALSPPPGEDIPLPTASPDLRRYAAYLRSLLPNLDAIAAGAD